MQKISQRIFGASGSVKRPILFIILALIISGAIAPSFLTSRNLSALLVSTSFLVVVTVGEALVIMTGMIDLGVESILASGGMLVAFLTVMHHISGSVSIVLTLLVGLVVGLVVGLLVTKGRIPSFIVTLGTYWGLKGIALLFNGGNYISPNNGEFGFSGLAGHILGIPTLVIIMIVIVTLAQIVLSYTPIGTWIKSVGSNELSAKTVGLNVDALKIATFMISGVLAAFAGVLIAAWQGSMYPTTGAGYSLQAIAAVILGGIPFTGGRGTIVGAAIGALIIGLISDMIVLLGLPSLYEYIFVAIILVIAGLQARAAGSGIVK
ncbi:ribose ABC transporter permease [Sulfobacillus acidophilus TPY]|uniref:Autoinducer 2 import system permease protein LsrC n=1 Tax=Sulfobacillus acidophilus (strain ATCC 700253 / DSM 10332 / NAL) TaxID=679936 RepID=G8TTK0_SULAD|nr:ribose ABC transporter permease [Sulfobacillus acidophilus TPY]AEW05666.1 ribose ABC transporter membrane protein [Sulfobacillus acidophilus DSM 10332]